MPNRKPLLRESLLLVLSLVFGLCLSQTRAHASSSTSIDLLLNVPSSCSLTMVGGTNNELSISNSINPGSYGTIGSSQIKAICNDSGGLAVYAIGYGDNVHGGTDLVSEANSNSIVQTNTYTSGNTSGWHMIVSSTANTPGNYAATISDGTNGTEDFTIAHAIPSVNTKIASYPATTDQTVGSNVTATFKAYVAPNQTAGTYNGKVKFTLVHPSIHAAPASRPATLDIGETVNAKMKSLAAGSSKTYSDSDSLIKSISVHTNASAPSGFTASDSNTISSATSESPIYIVFDNTNDAGIMHLYTEGDRIILLADSSYMFYRMQSLGNLLDLADWDTSNVANAVRMFSEAGYNATTFSLDVSNWDTSKVTDMQDMFSYAGSHASSFSLVGLSNWDTSKVQNMQNMFSNAGYSAPTTWSIGDLSGWSTSQVANMGSMFSNAGYSATTWSIGNLSNWDTSKVTGMNSMFYCAGRSATTWSIGNLSNWNTPKVESMYQMFSNAGRSATTWSIGDLSNWDTSQVTSMTYMFQDAGRSATTWSIGDLSNWDTSQVKSMSHMFSNAGYSATTWSIGNLSGWNTSQATEMNDMFSNAGYSASSFSLDLSSWDTSKVTSISNMFYRAGYNATTWTVYVAPINGGGISNSTTRLYGNTSTKYASPAGGRQFTIGRKLTLSLSTGVASVTIDSKDYSNGNIITLGEGSTYNIDMTLESGYEFDSWAVSGTGTTLGSASTQSTTLTMGTDAATLTATASPSTSPQNQEPQASPANTDNQEPQASPANTDNPEPQASPANTDTPAVINNTQQFTPSYSSQQLATITEPTVNQATSEPETAETEDSSNTESPQEGNVLPLGVNRTAEENADLYKGDASKSTDAYIYSAVAVAGATAIVAIGVATLARERKEDEKGHDS